MVPNSQSLVARIFGNVFIWSILVYGLFFILAYKVRILQETLLRDTKFFLGLHDGLQSLSALRRDRCFPILRTGHRIAVDLRVHEAFTPSR